MYNAIDQLGKRRSIEASSTNIFWPPYLSSNEVVRYSRKFCQVIMRLIHSYVSSSS